MFIPCSIIAAPFPLLCPPSAPFQPDAWEQSPGQEKESNAAWGSRNLAWFRGRWALVLLGWDSSRDWKEEAWLRNAQSVSKPA